MSVLAFPRIASKSISSLTVGQRKALNFITAYERVHGALPSASAIKQALSLQTTSQAEHLIANLVKRNAIHEPSP